MCCETKNRMRFYPKIKAGRGQVVGHSIHEFINNIIAGTSWKNLIYDLYIVYYAI